MALYRGTTVPQALEIRLLKAKIQCITYINITHIHTHIQTVVKRHSYLFKPLKIKIKLNFNLKKFRSYRAVNTLHPAYEKQAVNVVQIKMTVSSEIHRKHKCHLWPERVIFMRVRTIAESDYLFPHMSVRLSGTTRLPLDGLSLNLVCEDFLKICRRNLNCH